eukprot:CAMPEP_0196826968 /NCGR_PEP_ID=MMETSP1362-20130617/93907_1 /TAXON_ID=163516 /ORGANISM="Leptocylindrus danicus, Strain CCMP1856" /LENGTH=568 /DNA_ID=CAMNT_0042207577 /DNA_START=579 /DNA_END=2281 /DNA_ORIENTATION=-
MAPSKEEKVAASSKAEMLSEFSIDLVTNAKLHRTFLQSLHQHKISWDNLVLQNEDFSFAVSMHRYTQLWLPMIYNANTQEMLACKKQTPLVPPSDVAWLWHCHRLAPYDYMRYIKSQEKERKLSIEDAAFVPFSFQHYDSNTGAIDVCNSDEEVCRETRRLWERLYPKERFFLNDESSSSLVSVTDVDKSLTPADCQNECVLLNGFDLYGSTLRQATFLWQVSSPAFEDNDFLQDAVVNYFRFLSLKKHCADTVGKERFIIVPTYQIDLMWHTHMLADCNGTAYRQDCRRILGKTLDHDDSLNDRSEGSDLNRAFDATKKLWLEVYGVEYFVRGGMYRGEPPAGYYRSDWKAAEASILCNHHHSDVVGNAHLVDKAGASSTSPPSESTSVESRPRWITPGETSSTGKPGFIPMKEKSTTRGVNNNEQMKEYIFGDGPAGVGYYHMHTKEAYGLAITRFEKRIKDRECFLCASLIILPCLLFGICVYFELKDLKASLEVFRNQLNAPAPLDALPAEGVGAESKKKKSADAYWAAAACGAALYNHDCGGGTCGGADGGGACGGAACGGGG